MVQDVCGCKHCVLFSKGFFEYAKLSDFFFLLSFPSHMLSFTVLFRWHNERGPLLKVTLMVTWQDKLFFHESMIPKYCRGGWSAVGTTAPHLFLLSLPPAPPLFFLWEVCQRGSGFSDAFPNCPLVAPLLPLTAQRNSTFLCIVSLCLGTSVYTLIFSADRQNKQISVYSVI